ncbi:hypothetical protein BC831DRAFT_284172 [Entophlyctis helioformis]|nr:hypothetical protein BC831DRAFT_284172 [Entophlyctis helioformis]
MDEGDRPNFSTTSRAPMVHAAKERSRPRRFEALALKTVAYQKRQWVTNIVCVGLCPLFMVLASSILGAVITGLLVKSNTNTEFISCSNRNAMTPIGVPNWDETDLRNLPQSPGSDFAAIGATQDTVFHSNWAIIRPSGAAINAVSGKQPCSYWYGDEYPTGGSVYEPTPNVTGKLLRDSSNIHKPTIGWINAITTGLASKLIDTTTYTLFNSQQQRQWTIYGNSPNVSSASLGALTKQSNISFQQFALLPPTSPAFVSTNTTPAAGILGTLPTRYWLDLGSYGGSRGVQPVPWFEFQDGDSSSMDDYYRKALQTVIDQIARLDKSVLLPTRNSTVQEIQNLYLQIDVILNQLPYGAIYFTKVDHAAKQYGFNMHVGRDSRVARASRFPAMGARQLAHLTQLSNGILRNSNTATLGNARITQGFRVFPQLGSTALTFQFSGVIGGILFPFGVSFLLPIFSIILVQEKEARILMMMKMNGMKTWAYYLTHYLTFFVLFGVSAMVFFVSGYFAKLSFFTLTDPAVYLVLFFVWGNVQIALAFFFASVFKRSQGTLVVVFLLVLCSVLVSLAIDLLYPREIPPAGYQLWPLFAFYRALSRINRATFVSRSIPYKLSMLVPGDEVYTAIVYLSVEIFGFLGLAGYLNAVFPSEFGVQKPWHFPITEPIAAIQKYRRKKANGGVDPLSETVLAVAVDVNEAETQFEDADVKAERARVDDQKYDPASPLVMKHMRKVYAGRGGAGPKLAVKDVTFAVEEGIVFGLLGPNGAGKTTLISILTGLYEASTGVATLAGFDIKTQTSEVYKRIGICPQFDILWDDLTIEEHLYFYARLKGVPRDELEDSVLKAMQNVSLDKFATRITKGLSGGEKRRLSIAIALVGDPIVVFLDEPTTGLDPDVRRMIWNIVNEARIGKTIVLTTHSMEEAEALCQRIGIMAKGTLRCIANPIRLKQVYGSGFRLYFNSLIEDTPRASAFLESILPVGWTKVDAFATNTSYEFPPVDGVLSYLFEKIEAEKANYGILDWGIGQTTLEEVFIRLISEDDAGADAN